jgi:hypothetical protein
MKDLLNFITFKRIPLKITILSVLATFGALIVGMIDGWQLWVIALTMIMPWIFLFAFELQWSYTHYHWFTIFYITVLMQGGHMLEHVAQIIQIHVFDYAPEHAHGIFGALDVEWVHFVWNSLLLLFNILLIKKFPKNIFLWINAVAVLWHQMEHSYIMWVYLTTGISGDPGLLSQGGFLFGGLPFIRAEIHFIYNILETFPLAIAFILQLRTSYNEWLKRIFPKLSDQQLAKISKDIKILQFNKGDIFIKEGNKHDSLYIITNGLVKVSRKTNMNDVKIKAILEKGIAFGNTRMNTRMKKSTYTCLTKGEVIKITGSSIIDIIESVKKKNE